MWGREAVAAVTSVAFCPSWPVCYVVFVWRLCLSVITSVCALSSERGFRLLLCLPEHTTVSVGDEMFLEHTGKHAQRVCICVSVYTQRAASLGAPHQSARLCFCSCVALLLLFLPQITLQVLSRFLLHVPLLLSALVSRLRLSRLSSPLNSLSSCQQAGDWQSHSARQTSEPLIKPPLACPFGDCHDNGQIEWAALLPAC